MIYELRVYHCVPGRLPALLKRFDTMTLKIWEKHGIKPAGFFTTLIGESNQELTYFLAWESLADREKKWAAFGADPPPTRSVIFGLPAGCAACCCWFVVAVVPLRKLATIAVIASRCQ